MSEPNWLPIEYRDFHDVPRMILVVYGGTHYLLDSPFDNDADEYSDHFHIYRLSPEAVGRLDKSSWADLPRHGELVTRVPVTNVEFDSSKRRLISDAVLRRVT